MLSGQQKRVNFKKNMEIMSNQTKKLRDDGLEEIALTYYADEKPYRKMRLDVKMENFVFRQMMTVKTAKVMIENGLNIEVQVLDADKYFFGLVIMRTHMRLNTNTQVVNIYLALTL